MKSEKEDSRYHLGFFLFFSYAVYVVLLDIIPEFVPYYSVFYSAFQLMGFITFIALLWGIIKPPLPNKKIIATYSIFVFLISLWFLFDLTEDISFLDDTPLIGLHSSIRIKVEQSIPSATMVVFMFGTYLLLLEIHRRNQGIEKARAFVQSILCSVPDIIFRVDTEGIFTYISPSVERYGMAPDRLMGKSILELLHPDDKNKMTERLRTGQDSERLNQLLLFRFVWPNGTEFHFELSITPLYTDSELVLGVIHEREHENKSVETLTGFQGIARDISELSKTRIALKRQEEIYRETIDAAGIVVYYQNYETGLYDFMSPGIERILGYSVHDFTPDFFPVTEESVHFFNDNPDLNIGEKIKRFRTVGGHWQVDYLLLAKNGELKSLYNSAIQVRNEEGRIVGSMGILIDVTERKQLEIELRNEKRLLEEIIDGLPGFFFMFDESGRLVRWNQNYMNIIGYTPEQMQNLQIGDCTADTDEKKKATHTLQEILMKGHAEVEILAVNALNQQVPFYCYGSLYQSEGKKYIIGTGYDLSEQKKAEKEITDAKALLQASIDNSTAGIIIADAPNGRVRLMNSAALHLLLSTQSTSLQTEQPALHLEQFRQSDGTPYSFHELPIIRAIQLEERISNVEMIVRSADGEDRRILVNASPVYGSDGQVLAGVAVFLDITELKQKESEVRKLNEELEQRVQLRTAQLELANRELESFSYSVSHDLRSPLQAIDGFSEAILEDYGHLLDDNGKHYLVRIGHASQKMGAMIEAMLVLSRVTRIKLQRETVSLSSLASSILGDLQEASLNRLCECSVESNLIVEGDRHLLEIAMQNLLNNAWKFTSKQERACIEFGCRQMDGETVFFVQDNGAGFDMAYAGKLFGAFQRMHSEIQFPGTGVGLATVQRIIHRHGGRIWAEGYVNEGATFYFTLP